MIKPSSPLKYLKALIRADLSVLIVTKRSLVMSLILPCLLLVVWNSKKTVSAFGGKLFVLGLAMTIGIMLLSLAGYCINTSRDREKGIFQRLRVTPAPTWTIMVSRLLAYEIINLVIAIVVLIFGSRLYHITFTPVEYLLSLLVALLTGAIFLSIGQALTAYIKSTDTLNASVRFVYIGLVLFGSLGLSGALGHTVEVIAKWSPLGAVITIFEGLPGLGTWNGHSSITLLTCFVYVIVFGFIGIKWFKWDSGQ